MKPTAFDGYYSTIIAFSHFWIIFVSIQVSLCVCWPLKPIPHPDWNLTGTNLF